MPVSVRLAKLVVCGDLSGAFHMGGRRSVAGLDFACLSSFEFSQSLPTKERVSESGIVISPETGNPIRKRKHSSEGSL